MSRLPKSILSQQFDASLIYIPSDKALQPPTHVTEAHEWIDRLLVLNKEGIKTKGGSIPSVDVLVESMQRYDAIFAEIIKQTRVYSNRIAGLEEKAWSGVMELLECIIKSFHRHTKQTVHIQEEAKQVLAQKRDKEIVEKKRIEEFNFEKTSLRAQVRNLEGAVESLALENRILRREKDALRDVVREYISGGVDLAFGSPPADTASATTKTPSAVPQSYTHQQSNLHKIKRLDIEMNTVLDESLNEANKCAHLLTKLTTEWKKKQFEDYKSTMKSLANLKYSSYDYSPIITFEECGVQVDEKDIYGATDVNAADLLMKLLKKDPLPFIPWDNISRIPVQPSLLEQYMHRTYNVTRIPSIEWLHQLIYSVYKDKILHDQLLLATPNGAAQLKPSLAQYIYDTYFTKRFQMTSAVDVQCTIMLRAIETYLDSSSRVRLFARCLGYHSLKVATVPLDACDCEFLLNTFHAIFASNQVITDPKTLAPAIPLAFIYDLIQNLLGVWSLDTALECSKGIRALDSCGPKDSCVLVDDAVVVFIDNWGGVRGIFEDHIRYIAKRNCSVYRVVSELCYAHDEDDDTNGEEGNSLAIDVVLNKVQDKASAVDTMRRPLRVFDPQQIRVWSGREVCDILSKKEFYYSCLSMYPAISEEEVDSMFQEACDLITKRTLRACVEEGGWREVLLEEGKIVYANVHTKKLQWRKPYDEASFRDSSGVEIDTFVSMALQQNLLIRGPYSSFLSMVPSEFWPHAETFLREQKKIAGGFH